MIKKAEINSIFSIEVLRGVAVILVAFLHGREVGWIGTKSYLQINHYNISFSSLFALITQPVVFGSIGVPIFFVLSGYCIHRKTAISLSENLNEKNNIKSNLDFLRRRFIRIYPVLIGALLLTFLLDHIGLTIHPVNEKIQHVGFKVFMINLFALQGICGPSFGSNGALWSLAIEIQFYLVYPILLFIRKILGFNKTFIIVGFINIISWIVFPNITIFTSYYLSWYLGFYIAEIQANNLFSKFSKQKSLYISILLICFGCLAFFGHNEKIYFSLWAIGFSFYFWTVLHKEYSKNRFTELLAFFGKISYSLYAIHLPIFVFLIGWFYKSKQPISIVPSFISLIFIIGVAFVFYTVIERPSIKLLSRLRMTPLPVRLKEEVIVIEKEYS